MLAEGDGCSGPPDLVPNVEDVCEVIDRLELHRRCIDEALADAYWDLMAMLGCLDTGQLDTRHLDEAADSRSQELCSQERSGREAPRPF
jgi:hypothetical protein